MAAKFFTGLPLDGPDPECVQGHGERALAGRADVVVPRPAVDHSHRGGPAGGPVPVALTRRPPEPEPARPPVSDCDESPLAGFTPPIPASNTPTR
jgi:hypothetical protein